MKRHALLCLLFVAAAAHPSERWTHYGTSAAGTSFSFDSSSVSARGNVVTFWLKAQHAGGSSTGRVEADCARGRHRTRDVIDHDAIGRAQGAPSGPSAWEASLPGTMLGDLVREQCADAGMPAP